MYVVDSGLAKSKATATSPASPALHPSRTRPKPSPDRRTMPPDGSTRCCSCQSRAPPRCSAPAAQAASRQASVSASTPSAPSRRGRPPATPSCNALLQRPPLPPCARLRGGSLALLPRHCPSSVGVSPRRPLTPRRGFSRAAPSSHRCLLPPLLPPTAPSLPPLPPSRHYLGPLAGRTISRRPRRPRCFAAPSRRRCSPSSRSASRTCSPSSS